MLWDPSSCNQQQLLYDQPLQGIIDIISMNPAAAPRNICFPVRPATFVKSGPRSPVSSPGAGSAPSVYYAGRRILNGPGLNRFEAGEKKDQLIADYERLRSGGAGCTGMERGRKVTQRDWPLWALFLLKPSGSRVETAVAERPGPARNRVLPVGRRHF